MFPHALPIKVCPVQNDLQSGTVFLQVDEGGRHVDGWLARRAGHPRQRESESNLTVPASLSALATPFRAIVPLLAQVPSQPTKAPPSTPVLHHRAGRRTITTAPARRIGPGPAVA